MNVGVEHDGLGVGVVEQVDDLVGAVAVVRVDRRQAGLEGGDVGLEVLGAVVEVGRDLGLVAEAGVEEVGGQGVGPAVELAPRDHPVALDLARAGRAPRPATASKTSAKFQFVIVPPERFAAKVATPDRRGEVSPAAPGRRACTLGQRLAPRRCRGWKRRGMPAATEPIIRTVGLTKIYPGGIEAVKGVDLEICPGEIYGLLGPNGAGKTTTIGMLTTRVIPTSGQARWAAST